MRINNFKGIAILLFICINLITCFAQNNYPIIKSNNKHIHYIVNNKVDDWNISPEIKPDRLFIYCSNKNNVKFKTDIDSISFIVENKDTFRFFIDLKGYEKALTEIVGIKDVQNTINNNDKVYYLSIFWSEVKYNFVNMDKINFNLDSIYQIYISKVLNTKNDYEYYQELKRFSALFKDGHTQVVDNGQFNVFRDYIGATFIGFGKDIFLVNYRKGIGLDTSYLGAKLLQIKNIPIEEYLNKYIFPFISASTEQSKRMQGISKIHSGFKSEMFEAKVKKTNGEIKTISLPFNGESTRTDNQEYYGVMPEYSNSLLDFKWLTDSIAFIAINAFYPEEMVIKQFDKFIPDIQKAKGLIIDLRKNGGGSTEVAWHIQSFLTKNKYFLNFSWQTRINNSIAKANGNWKIEYKDFYNNCKLEFNKPDTIFISDSISRINVPTVIIFGKYTFSAAEDLLVNLFEVPNRPVFIGESTGGSTGSPLVLQNFPNDGYARICTRRICYPYSSKPFINEGIKPDIEVKQNINDYLLEKDVVLNKAIEVIQNKIK